MRPSLSHPFFGSLFWACLKNRPVRGPGLQGIEILAVSCRPRALTRRFGRFFKQALREKIVKIHKNFA
jgi:hypothetical protein